MSCLQARNQDIGTTRPTLVRGRFGSACPERLTTKHSQRRRGENPDPVIVVLSDRPTSRLHERVTAFTVSRSMAIVHAYHHVHTAPFPIVALMSKT